MTNALGDTSKTKTLIADQLGTPSHHVQKAYIDEIIPNPSKFTKSFVADTDILEGEIVQLKSNGNIEKIEINNYTALPQFPVAPYQQFVGTGGTPQAYTSVLFSDLNRCLIGYENTSQRSVNLVYGDIDKGFPNPFSFNPVNQLYQAPVGNTITMVRFIEEGFNPLVQKPRGLCIYSETGAGASVGTWLFGYEFDFITNTVLMGDKYKFNVAGIEADAVFLNENAFGLYTADNTFEYWGVDWINTGTEQFPLQKINEVSVSALTTVQYPQVNTFEAVNGDRVVVCWYRTTINRASKTPVIVDLVSGAVDIGTESTGGTSTGSAGYRITKNYDVQSCYSKEDRSNSWVSFLKHTYDPLTKTLAIDGSFVNIGSGDCNGIEFLELTGIGKLLVWFCEAYIVNYPLAGFYNLDTASNFSQTIVSSSPASFGSIGIIQEDADVILGWQGPGDGRAVLCNIGDAVGNLNSDRIIGVADETKATGQNVKVNLLGSVGDVSKVAPALSPVSECYVQLNGDITQVPATGEVSIGKALSSGEILLSPNPTAL